MSRTMLTLSPHQPAPDVSAVQGKTCPFASSCSCIFSRSPSTEGMAVVTDTALQDDRVSAEITDWTDRGWKVISADSHEVVLERQRNLPFCLNVLLCLLTGFLWLIYWIPRARNPKIDTKIVSVPPRLQTR
jgi:hypothetical protein